jgi:hypothetical protein
MILCLKSSDDTSSIQWQNFIVVFQSPCSLDFLWISSYGMVEAWPPRKSWLVWRNESYIECMVQKSKWSLLLWQVCKTCFRPVEMFSFWSRLCRQIGACGSVVGWGTMLQAGRLGRGRVISDDIIGFFNWSNPFSCTMALWLAQPLTGMSTRNLGGGGGGG